MRSISTTVAITAAGLLLFSQFAQASDVEAELRQMQERIANLEGQLGDETDSLLPTKEEVGSSLSSILENTDIGGWAGASYNYNFEGHHNDAIAALPTHRYCQLMVLVYYHRARPKQLTTNHHCNRKTNYRDNH